MNAALAAECRTVPSFETRLSASVVPFTINWAVPGSRATAPPDAAAELLLMLQPLAVALTFLRARAPPSSHRLFWTRVLESTSRWVHRPTGDRLRCCAVRSRGPKTHAVVGVGVLLRLKTRLLGRLAKVWLA